MEGIQPVKKALTKTDFSVEGKDFLVELLFWILTCNYLMSGNNFYLQCHGTAMGSNMAPTFANIFLANIDEDLVHVSHHFGNVLWWWRYIDNVFLIWTGTEAQLQDFFEFLNGLNNTVKFTLTWSQESLVFLDTLV